MFPIKIIKHTMWGSDNFGVTSYFIDHFCTVLQNVIMFSFDSPRTIDLLK